MGCKVVDMAGWVFRFVIQAGIFFMDMGHFFLKGRIKGEKKMVILAQTNVVGENPVQKSDLFKTRKLTVQLYCPGYLKHEAKLDRW